MLAFHLPLRAANEPEQPPDSPAGQFAPNAFIRIDHAGKTTLVMPQVEMGQGIYTSISMILAEELDADWAQVMLEHAPPNDKLYANPIFGIQVTGNSNSIRAFWKPLRMAGAGGARDAGAGGGAAMAGRARKCSRRERQGHPRRERPHARLWRLGRRGRPRFTPPQDPPLKDPKDFPLIGQPLKRFDTPGKVNGKVVYGIDAMLPGMKFATLAASPVLGGKIAHVDDSAAKAVPGVRQIVVLDDLVAVVGDHMWAAKYGLEALDITWNEGANAEIPPSDIWDDLRAGQPKGRRGRKVRSAISPRLLGERATIIEAAFEMPLLAHAPHGADELHGPSSRPMAAKYGSALRSCAGPSAAAEAAGLPVDKVTVHNHLLGGGFGRRLETDMVAARCALPSTSTGR